jgi:hypothetical protein
MTCAVIDSDIYLCRPVGSNKNAEDDESASVRVPQIVKTVSVEIVRGRPEFVVLNNVRFLLELYEFGIVLCLLCCNCIGWHVCGSRNQVKTSSRLCARVRGPMEGREQTVAAPSNS